MEAMEAEARNDFVSRHMTLSRRGDILGKGAILKADLYTDVVRHHNRVPYLFSGAPNFRTVQSDTLPFTIAGVSQPTQFGVQTILNKLVPIKDHTRDHKVLWINLREEPVIYINSRPFVLREYSRPLENTSYTSMILNNKNLVFLDYLIRHITKT